tara:strand:- start:2311 stop:2517 length:207 start_codon:yes stop_codon:yes gene_type:complete
MTKYKALKKRLKIYLLKREVRGLKRDLNRVSLHLYFDRWTGADCIEESEYLRELIKEKEKNIIYEINR